jgi:hypothetical protein
MGNNEARFDYNPATLAPLGLLIEEQRTNLLTHSEQFNNNADWTKVRASITANTTVSPDGTLDGDKLVEDSSASTTHILRPTATFSVTSGASYTFSILAKAAERTQIQLSFGTDGSAFTLTQAIFTLSGSGTATANGGSPNPTITSVGNGWFRCSINAVATATTSLAVLRLFLVNGGTDTYTGDGTSGLYIWGAQLEAGAFPTSYIPTVASQVTRSADAASMTGANFSSWYRQGEGTLFWDGSGVNAFGRSMLSISDNTTSNRIRMVWTTSNGRAINTEIVTSGTFQGSVPSSVSTITTGQQYKLSFAYNTNDLAGSRDGGAVGTDTSALIPVVDRMFIGAGPTGAFEYFGGHIRTISFYPKRLADSQLQALTVV